MANTSSSSSSLKQKQKQSQLKKCRGFLDVIFSWSLSDILDKHLYKFQVEEIPLTFSSTTHYMNSFMYPLLEETHADLQSQLVSISKAPSSRVIALQRTLTGNPKDLLYQMTLTAGSNYEPMVGDLVAFTEVKPKHIDHLARSNGSFVTGYVTRFIDQTVEVILSSDEIESSNQFEGKEGAKGFVVYLSNLTTNMRIWQALNLNTGANMNVIERTLSSSLRVARDSDKCCTEGEKGVIDIELRHAFDSFKLDTSQESAVLTCLAPKKSCHKNSFFKLIWGPPGTGKTKTMASLLFVLLRTKHRTLTCAPTNIAVVGVAKRLLSLVTDHDMGCDTYGIGDIVLFGNQERMKIIDHHEELLDVFLDHRIDVLGSCLSLWKTCVNDMIRLLEDPMTEHRRFIVPKPNDTEVKSKYTKKKDGPKGTEDKSRKRRKMGKSWTRIVKKIV